MAWLVLVLRLAVVGVALNLGTYGGRHVLLGAQIAEHERKHDCEYVQCPFHLQNTVQK